MMRAQHPAGPAFRYDLTVGPSAIDANGHANNVEYVRWMQEAGVAHSDAVGCTAATRAARAMWFARSHHIEYRRPAREGDAISVITWVDDLRRSFSTRRYRFERASDGTTLAEGATEWVFVDAATGRPRSILPEIVEMFRAGAGADP
jgi:acyl-CoA thioester hydrolase